MMFKRELTENQMRAYFPAMFAEAPASHTSDRYLYIPTHRLVNKLVENGFSIAGARQSGGRTSHGKHVVYMTPGKFEPNRLREVGDEIPLLKITNSHDAGSAFKLDTSFYRLVCSNGLMMPKHGHNSARIIHTKNFMDDVIEAAFTVTKTFPEQVRQIGEMKEIGMARDEQHLLAESAANLAFDQELIQLNKDAGRDVEGQLLRRRHWEDRGKNDLWTTFNAVQENIIKGGVRMLRQNDKGQRSFRKTRAVTSIDRDAKLNQELMTLAQKFAELKAGA